MDIGCIGVGGDSMGAASFGSCFMGTESLDGISLAVVVLWMGPME